MDYLAEYSTWSVLRQKVYRYRFKIAGFDELRTRLIDE